ncbi:hypothetical protein A6A04_10720 [Paramagnetospirillum marisnigri]|uniref:HTH luxR-type domain-containing protein n=1 Tax=Paramagnetospirillum marisnigri TaxID=1285242 RepID=A0A178MZN1_9PROT|nr:PAS-domain containing protein [Paramagnetospirillum marisnigri]OAN56021.1 hypothetical protein A6A04_10720 [Paramagnetospirillum marisnigri]
MRQQILDALDDGIASFDASQRLTAWNRAFVDLLDFPAGLMRPGTPFLDFVDFNIARGEHGSGERRIIVGQRLSLLHDTYERRRPNGLLLRVRGKPMPDGGFVKIFTALARADAATEGPSLSAREREVLLWAARGKTSWETSVLVGISPKTVEFHLSNCRRKLGVASKIRLVAEAVARGLIPL